MGEEKQVNRWPQNDRQIVSNLLTSTLVYDLDGDALATLGERDVITAIERAVLGNGGDHAAIGGGGSTASRVVELATTVPSGLCGSSLLEHHGGCSLYHGQRSLDLHGRGVDGRVGAGRGEAGSHEGHANDDGKCGPHCEVVRGNKKS